MNLRSIFVTMLFALASACGASGEGGVVPIDSAVATDTTTGEDTAPKPDVFTGTEPAWAVMESPSSVTWLGIDGGGTTEDNAWFAVVGPNSSLLRWNKGSWSYMTAGVNDKFNAVKAFQVDDMIICGDAGAIWKLKSGGPGQPPSWVDLTALWFKKNLVAVDGLSAEDFWLVGKEGSVLHYSGGKLEEVPPATLGLSGDPLPDCHDVLVTADGGVDVLAGSSVLHFDGATWSVVMKTSDSKEFSTGEQLAGIAERNGVTWVGGSKGALARRVNGAWEFFPATAIYYSLESIFVDSDGVVFASGPRTGGDATLWYGEGDPWEQNLVESPDFVPEDQKIQKPFQVEGIWGVSSNYVFVCTDNGQILHWAVH